MKRRIYVLFLSSVFISACGKNSVEQKEEKLLSDMEEIPTWIDSIEVGQPLEFSTSEVFPFPYKEFQLVQSKKRELLNKNKFPANDTISYPYTEPDSIVAAVPEYAIAEPFVSYVQHPAPVKAGPLRSSQNASENIQYLDVEQGLSTSILYEVKEDQFGFLWISSGHGLTRYDGNYFYTYTTENGLPSNTIYEIFFDSKNRMWLGTDQGMVLYDGIVFKVYNELSGLKANTNHSFNEDKEGNIWFNSYDAAVTKLSGDSLTHYTKESGLKFTPQGVVLDSLDRPFIKYFYSEPTILDGDKFLHYGNINKAAHNFGTVMISSAYRDRQNRLWVAAYNGDFTLTSVNGPSRRFKAKSGKNNPAPRMMYQDKAGNYWFSRQDAGMSKYSGGDSYTGYTTDQGLTSNNISGISEDRAGNIWMATSGGGLNKLTPSSFKTYTGRDGFTEKQATMLTSDSCGNLYIGTFVDGVWCFDGNEFRKYGGGRIATSVKIDAFGDLVVGWHQGGFDIFKTCEDTAQLIHRQGNAGIQGMSVWQFGSIEVDKDGNLWFADDLHGIYRLNIDKDSSKYDDFVSVRKENGLHNNGIRELVCDHENNIWVSYSEVGISKISADRKTITHYTEKSGLASNLVYDIYEMKSGEIWIGTNEGVSIMSGEEFRSIGLEDGLSSKTVTSIIEDPSGRIWLGTGNGLNLLEKDDTKDCGYAITTFGVQDGLKSTFFQQRGVHIDMNNQIWWITRNGLLMLDLDDFNRQLIEPEVRLTGINIHNTFVNYAGVRDSIKANQPYYLGETGKDLTSIEFDSLVPYFNYPKHLTLPYQFNSVTFLYGALGGQAPYHIQYRYRLIGQDEIWSSGDKSGFAKYSNLSAGDYTFEVQAKVQNHPWGATTSYSFSVLPPWYQTWWALLLYVAFAVLVVVGYSRWRNAKLQARQKELESEIDKATTEIRYQKEEIELQHQEIRDSIDYAKRIQSAILPPIELLKDHIKESFILYKPKDVVAGDFYWIEEIGEQLFFAAADCTGHGVPGAMVSVVCNHALNRAVREFGCNKPGTILDKARDLVIEEFEKSGEAVKDGMDIALCSLTSEGLQSLDNNGSGSSEEITTLLYAGAHNPLWIIRKGSEEVEEIRANKQPIGKFDDPQPYTTHTIQLNKGDTIYIFSDGYADQFGGDKGKKYKGANFKRLLLSLQSEPFSVQSAKINASFEDWRGELEQVDDVCVIGVRV